MVLQCLTTRNESLKNVSKPAMSRFQMFFKILLHHDSWLTKPLALKYYTNQKTKTMFACANKKYIANIMNTKDTTTNFTLSCSMLFGLMIHKSDKQP